MQIDKESFVKLYREYHSRLFYFAYDFVQDAEASKDIVNDVFEFVWRERHRMTTGQLGGYLFISVRNKCISHLQKVRKTENYERFLNAIAEEDEPYWLHMEERIQIMRDEINHMPERTRFVLEECYFNNRSYQEVADMMGISPSGIKKHIVKALALLRKRFNVNNSKK